MTNTENDWRDIKPRSKRTWTVMVYMAAEDTSELDAVASLICARWNKA